MPSLQEIIYKLEVGAGARWLRLGAMGLLVLVLFIGYNVRSFRNMAAPEAMDAAQLARNISEGKGYTTDFIRPISTYLLKANGSQTAAAAQLKGAHPDLANAPLYPLVLAGLMKTMPFRYTVDTNSPFLSIDSELAGHRVFWRYQPDLLIALFNELLFVVVIILTYLLAKRLFDTTIAWVSALLLACTEVFWRFSVSGLSTMLLMVIFMGLVWALVLLEESARENKWGRQATLGFAVLAGALVGLGALTRYSFGWLIIPVLLFVIIFGGNWRVVLGISTAAIFLALLLPWVSRNVVMSGMPFGTATLAVLENTPEFPDNKLERSLTPEFDKIEFGMFHRKLLGNARTIVEDELPRVGGSWATLYFLAGLLVSFRSPSIGRLRYFMLASLLLLIVVEALGRTALTDATPDINSENLLILLFPLILIYGVVLFFMLADQLQLPDTRLRPPIMALFGLLCCSPMVFAFLPPRPSPIVYPPYHPAIIQKVGDYMEPDELVMSDIPWAMAWYGHRQCIWLTLNAQTDFFAVNDYVKPVKALYLTPETMDSRFLSQWIRSGEFSWGSFILQSLTKKEIPPSFPLRKMPAGYLPEQLFLTDYERWKK